jgi:deazaflavin-dependent oxidoreductase (nitroreductase family)
MERLAIHIEEILMTKLVPLNQPGPVFKWLFKIPIFFYKIGLPLFSNFVLLLTTTGRKSGQPRFTPLEYRREPGTGYPVITAGWGGQTDWRRNVQANPRVQVQIGRDKFAALAEPLSETEVADWIATAIRLNPRSARMFARWAGEPLSLDNPESLLRAARFFPSFRLKPLD